ncbi:MAG: hypothetical protein JXX14_11890, partial [Deltaproteobacteria bacterium]|nr:hypothetical protein [Deltaproteobacteria bacterium]
MHSAKLKTNWLYLWCCAGFVFPAVIGCGDDSGGAPADIEGDVAGECSDDADNDRDGLFDCYDPDCAGSSFCKGSVADTGDTAVSSDSGFKDTGTGSAHDTGSDNAQDTGTGSAEDTGTGSAEDTGTGSAEDTGTGSAE